MASLTRGTPGSGAGANPNYNYNQNNQQQPEEQEPRPVPENYNQPAAVETRTSPNSFFDSNTQNSTTAATPQTEPPTEPAQQKNTTNSTLMSAPPPSPAGYPPPAHSKPIESSNDSHQSASNNTTLNSNQLPPWVIAIIIVIPILAVLLSVFYWRMKVHRRTHLYAHRISQVDQNTSSTAPRHIIPPGGTGADRPEGQRRADRMRRLMNGINRRPSRSDSVRTVPQYSADPQDTEMTLARAQRSAENSPPAQPSFIMRFIGNHSTTNPRTHSGHNNTAELPSSSNPQPPHPPEPPPDYELSTRITPAHYPPIQSSSNAVGSSSTRALMAPLQLPAALELPFGRSRGVAEHPAEDEDHPQHHTVHLDRSTTSSSTSSSETVSAAHQKSTRRPSLCNLINHPTSSSSSHQALAPENNHPSSPHHQLRLPSGGVTPQQLSFLGRIGNFSRLGLSRPPDPVLDDTLPPPAFDHLASSTLPSSSSSSSSSPSASNIHAS
ncbi:hypothetical protein PGT21_034592 [Puccinia graminis f. sp. tritici]|uniref:Uncharacterized protein n=2 Tax=Puccinia graminis f. sp. tritici TaxID=56615 RepID=A0A5B0NE39_PUCGR|nr:hypothetical protein PGT21_034592 [Puccinia graminis f. sp. tritici]